MTDNKTEDAASGKKRLTLSIKPGLVAVNKEKGALTIQQGHGRGKASTMVQVVKVKRKISDGRDEEANEALFDSDKLRKLELLKKAAEEDAATEQLRLQEEERRKHERALEEQERLEALVDQDNTSSEESPAFEETPEVLESAIEKTIIEKPRYTEDKPADKTILADDDEGDDDKKKLKKSTTIDKKKPTNLRSKLEEKRQPHKLTIVDVFRQEGEEERIPSLASLKRRREKERKQRMGISESQDKIIREVILPEVITVQELANRMAERTQEVVRELMKLGIMANSAYEVDADTAEIIIHTFGHKFKRVTEADVENILIEQEDLQDSLEPRAPVVTVMGHVDHGKTSLLDALRSTDIAAGEAGGITQHIGAYRVQLASGEFITFLDTPGHEAFTAMRSRGAKATDIVILVVAADDGIMAQTVEALNHAKAANVPIIVAINKIDKPAADPARVKGELLNHGLVPEEFGGDIMCIEVSAKNRINLDKLEEIILLQAEMLQLKANYNRKAVGAVIESKVEKGRGVVTTLLVQKGTLAVGDLIVAGTTYGRVRAITDDKGKTVVKAFPSMPVEIIGLAETPDAGEKFSVVQNEKQARDIAEFRLRKIKDSKNAPGNKISLEDLFVNIGKGAIKELPIIIKTDVQGSAEAIKASLEKIQSNEVKVKVLHAAVGGITESDIMLANASRAIILGFNVRSTPNAKILAEKEGVDIRYYNIIYNLVDDVKSALSGMLSPHLREVYLGTVEIRQVLLISKYGKIAGSYVTDGVVKRGAHVRLLRDNIVIHEGKLKTLRRFKDEVKEVSKNFECGIGFENYEDIKEGDIVEAYEIVEEAKKIL